MFRRDWLKLVLVAGPFSSLFPSKEKDEEKKWKSSEEVPELFSMRLYGMGSVVRRSLVVLCKNSSHVFTGFAIEENGMIRWYMSGDDELRHPMYVEEWQLVEADVEQLHLQWSIGRKKFYFGSTTSSSSSSSSSSSVTSSDLITDRDR